jgi:peptidoglycan/LPS O-acetylase OafA/YrhL
VQPTLAVPATSPTSAAASPQAASKDNTAEGLRGLTAITVFLAHFFVAFFPRGFDYLYPGLQTSPATDGTVERILRMPFISILWNGNFVCIFFVLSGYVLSRPYYFGNRLETLRDRHLKRYLRLSIPIAASVFIGYFMMKYGLLLNHAGAAVSHSDWLNSYFAFIPTFPDALRDATYRVILLRADRFNPPLWTMKIEFIGSLITFSFYTLMPQGNWRKVIHYAIAVLTIGVLAGKDGIFYYSFLLGGLIWALPKPSGIYTWLLLAGAWLLESFQYTPLFHWMPDPVAWDQKFFYGVLGAFAVLWFLRSGAWDGFLGSVPMRSLGRIAYSMYVTHFFILCTFSCWFMMHWYGRVPRPVWASADLVLSALIIFTVGYVFERLVDRPGTRFANWVIGRPPV